MRAPAPAKPTASGPRTLDVNDLLARLELVVGTRAVSPLVLTVGSAIRHLIPAVGLALLFTPASNAWFRDRNGA